MRKVARPQPGAGGSGRADDRGSGDGTGAARGHELDSRPRYLAGADEVGPRTRVGRALGRRAGLAPFRYPAFRRVVAARAVSNAGSWMQAVAAGWLMFKVTDSAAAVGAITIASRGPGIVLSSYGGVLADRFDDRRLGAGVSLVQAVAAAALAASALAGKVDAVEIYVATFVIGAAGAIASPLVQDVVPRSVPADLLAEANSLSATVYTLARMVGPLAGGGVVAAFGVSACFWVNAASFLAVVAMFVSLPAAVERPGRAQGGLRAAIHETRLRPLLFAALVGVGAFSLLVAPIQELAPVIARRHGHGAHVVGFLLGALALGTVLGSLAANKLIIDNRPRRYAIAAPSALAGVAVVGLGLAPNLALALIAMAVAGFFWECFFVTAQIALEEASPPDMLGREMGLFFALTLGGLAVGAPLIGLIFDVTSVRVGLIIGGCLMVVFDAWRLNRVRRRALG